MMQKIIINNLKKIIAIKLYDVKNNRKVVSIKSTLKKTSILTQI